jgi:hypothetical protein
MQSIGLLLKVLWSPGEAMYLLSKNPRVLAPILFLSLFSALAGGAILMKVDSSELAIRMLERPGAGMNLAEEQKELIRESMNSPVTRGMGFATTFLGPIFVVVLVAGIYFVIFTVVGREGGFKSFFSITAFAFIPGIFRQLAMILTVFVVPSSSLMPDQLGSVSPAVFLDRDSMSPLLFAAVNSVDAISIWILILLIIGYGFVTPKSVSKAARAGAVVCVFLVYVTLRLAVAALQGI